MDNIEITNEIAHLEAMYKHYKILYRKLMLCACCSNEIKIVKRNRDKYKLKLQEIIDLRCQNVSLKRRDRPLGLEFDKGA